MSDVHTPRQRSYNMSRIRGTNTKPEMRVRSILHREGFRYRLHVKDLPGKPDIVLPRYRAVIFVHGCFWHRHQNCRFATTPAKNALFWQKKFDGNVERDKKHAEQLKNAGWDVFVVWECEIRKDEEQAVRRLVAEFRKNGS